MEKTSKQFKIVCFLSKIHYFSYLIHISGKFLPQPSKSNPYPTIKSGSIENPI